MSARGDKVSSVRSCFIPRPGHVFVSVDFDTAELRSLAQVCLLLVGYSKLGEALQRGEDPHLILAAQMLKISYAEAVKRYNAGDEVVDKMRQFCKIGNFGFPGGLGEETFIAYAAGYGVTVTMKEAHDLRNAWFAAWSEMKHYFNKINGVTGPLGGRMLQLRVGGTPGNRKWLKHRMRGEVYFTQAANGYFQGLTADGAKHALWLVTRACYEAKAGDLLYGVRPVAFLHDEIMCEIPYDEARPELASAAAYEIARIMREAMQSWVPDIPIKCGPAMFRRWLKGAKAVHVERDNVKVLVPSKPVKVVKDGQVSTKWMHDTVEEMEQIAA